MPLMRLFGECTQKHGMWAVVWSCRAENIAMNECMKEEMGELFDHGRTGS
jgi:hypothetical protein